MPVGLDLVRARDGRARGAARRGNIQAHRGWMIGLYLGLAIAGAFTLLPSRLIGSLGFGI